MAKHKAREGSPSWFTVRRGGAWHTTCGECGGDIVSVYRNGNSSWRHVVAPKAAE